MASSFFNSNNCSGRVLAKYWWLCTQLAAIAHTKFAAVFLVDFKSRLCAKSRRQQRNYQRKEDTSEKGPATAASATAACIQWQRFPKKY
jgi:hypothetical protein